jgi:hypothetical protein
MDWLRTNLAMRVILTLAVVGVSGGCALAIYSVLDRHSAAWVGWVAAFLFIVGFVCGVIRQGEEMARTFDDQD